MQENVALHFVKKGKGNPFFFVHGFLGSGDNWATMSKNFEDDFCVIRPDLRNHGKSPHTTRHDYHLMAEDLHRLFQKSGLHPAVALGHSMGGKAVMQWALSYPEDLKAIIIVDSRPGPFKGGHEVFIRALLKLEKAQYERRSDLDKHLSKEVPSRAVRLFLLKNFKRHGKSFLLKPNLKLFEKQYYQILQNVDGPISNLPALFVKGSQSDYIRSQDLVDIRRLFPSFKLATIEGAGHWVHAEKPNELFKEIKQFIDRLED